MQTIDLHNKHVLLTGAAAGIGEATAYTLANAGAKLTITDRDEKRLADVAQAIRDTHQGEVVEVVSTLHDQVQCEKVLAAHHDTYGSLDVLINNASSMQGASPLSSFTSDDFEAMLYDNVYSLFHMTHTALPHLHKNEQGAQVINVGSISGIMGQPQQAPYAGTKAYIHAFTRTLAAEQAPHGVRFNSVAPGPIATQMTEEKADAVASAVPMGRRGTPFEIANSILFLCSSLASYINGETIVVDGGMTSPGDGSQASEKLSQPPKYPYQLLHQYDGEQSNT